MSPNDPTSIPPGGVPPAGDAPEIAGQPPELPVDAGTSSAGGVIDPGEAGDEFERDSDRANDLMGRLFGNRRSRNLRDQSFFHDGQHLILRQGDRTQTVTVRARGDSFFIFDKEGELASDGFLYESSGLEAGLLVNDKLLYRGQYEIILTNGSLAVIVDRVERRIIGNVIYKNRVAILQSKLDELILPPSILLDGKNFHVDQHTGWLTPEPIPVWPDLSPFLDRLESLYDSNSGLLTLAGQKGEQTAVIDLRIPALPRCRIESIRQKDNTLVINFTWDDKHRLTITVNASGEALAINELSLTQGGKRRENGYGRKIQSVKTLKDILEQYALRVRHVTIQTLAKNPKPIGAQILRYDDLGDHYENSKITRSGIRTWADLEAFVAVALDQAQRGQSVEIEIEQRFLQTLQPPPEFLARVGAWHAMPLQTTLVVKGNRVDRPTVYRFAEDGVHASLLERDEAAVGFWHNFAIQHALNFYFNFHPEESLLYQSLTEAGGEIPSGTLGDLLERTIEKFNNLASPEQRIPDNRRTQIYRRLDRLIEGLQQVAEGFLTETGSACPAGALYWDPVSTLLRKYPASSDPRHHAVILGGGQMGAAWGAWIRNRVDAGETVEIGGIKTKLPLDTRITVVEWSEALVHEMDRKGINRVAFGDLQINPDDRRELYYLPLPLRNELLAAYPGKMVIFALKADQLVAKTEDPLFVELLRRLKPAMPTPAKSFVPGELIPFGALLKRWGELGDGDLADLEVVNGGYEKGRSIIDAALGTEGKDGELYMLFVAESQEAIDLTRFFFGDRNITYARGRELALLVQAAGALKNISTYTSGRVVMRRLLGKETPSFANLQQVLDAEITDNIELIEETIARIAPMYGMATYHLSIPYEVQMDVRKCLELKLKDLISIRSRFEVLMREGNLADLDQIIKEIVDGNTELGGGTRNPRDGLIDELIFTAYHAFVMNDMLDDGDMMQSFVHGLKREGERQGYQKEEISAFVDEMFFWAQKAKEGVIPQATTFEDFYEAHYPESWKGNKKQEGRNAIGPLVDYGDEHQLTLPHKINVASNLYRHGEARAVPSEYRRWELTGEDHPVWGIPTDQIQKLGNVVNDVRSRLSQAVLRGDDINSRFLAVGFARLVRAINLQVIDQGAYTEINRRLHAVREGAEILKELLANNNIQKSRVTEAIREFQATLNEAFELTILSDTTTIVVKLRRVVKQLYAVEKAICEELAQQGKAIDPRRERRSEAVRRPARGDGPGLAVPSPLPQASINPARDPSGDGPQNSVSSPEMMMAGGAVYAGLPAVDGANALAPAPEVFLTEPEKPVKLPLEIIEGGKGDISFPVQSFLVKDGRGESHRVTIQNVSLHEAQQRLARQNYPDRFDDYLTNPDYNPTHCFLASDADGQIVGYIVANIRPHLPNYSLFFIRGHKLNFEEREKTLKGLFWAMTAYVLSHTRPLWEEKQDDETVIAGVLREIINRFRSREFADGIRSPVAPVDPAPWADEDYAEQLSVGQIPRNEAKFVTSLFHFDDTDEKVYDLDESNSQTPEDRRQATHHPLSPRAHLLRSPVGSSRLIRTVAKL